MRRRSRRVTRVLLGVLCAAVLAPGIAHAEDEDEVGRKRDELVRAHADPKITSIRIDGLRRTHPAVVQQWIECEVGQPLSGCDLPAIHRRIFRLGIFRTLDIELHEQPSGVEIVFRIEEKWTLYPVPILWYTPGTWVAGLMLVEGNLLGYNKGAALGGVYSNRGWYAIGGYVDPNIAFTNAWGTVHGFLGSTLLENDAPDGTIVQSFDVRRFDVEYALGWTFWDRLSPAWTGGVRIARVGDVHVPGEPAATNATVLLQGLNLIYSDRRYRSQFDEGLRLSAEVLHGFPLDRETPSYNTAIFDAKWARHGPLDGFIDVRARVFLGAMPVVFEERLGGLDGSRTLPGTALFAADRYASLNVAYQVPFLSLGPGTASGVAFGEVGRYSRNEEPGVTYGGPGVGLRLYLKSVAMPAVGVDVGYELGSRRVAFSLVVGYRPTR